MPQPWSVGTWYPPGGARGGFLGIALTEINYAILSDNVAKSMLSFGADVVKVETNIWGHLGNGGSGLWSIAWKLKISVCNSWAAKMWLRFRSSWCWTTWMPRLGVGRALLPYLRSHAHARRPLFWISGGIKYNRNKRAFPHCLGSHCVALSVSLAAA